MAGTLYLVTTPIGNLEDITLRALRVLKEVNLIAAEDTRHTRQLLTHFDIHTPLESFHAFNEHEKTAGLLQRINDGLNVALVSDAGTPSVADPGFFLVREALKQNINPVVIPGVSAVTFSVTASGLPVDRFAFFGFAPVKPGKRRTFFTQIGETPYTVFFFESPFRMEKTLKELAEVLGNNQPVAIIREATKIHEEIIRGTAGELAALKRQWRGEFVIGIGKRDKSAAEDDSAETEI